MNLKGLLLLIIALNIVSAYFVIGCYSQRDTNGNNCGISEDNTALNFFFDYNKEDAMKSTQIDVSQSMESELEASLKEESGGSSTIENLTKFLDGLRMIIGFLTLLTPFPIIIFFTSLGVPSWILMIIVFPLVAGWIISIIDIIRGFKS